MRNIYTFKRKIKKRPGSCYTQEWKMYSRWLPRRWRQNLLLAAIAVHADISPGRQKRDDGMNRSRNFSHLRLPSKHTKHHQRLNSHYSLRFLWIKKEFVFFKYYLSDRVKCFVLLPALSHIKRSCSHPCKLAPLQSCICYRHVLYQLDELMNMTAVAAAAIVVASQLRQPKWERELVSKPSCYFDTAGLLLKYLFSLYDDNILLNT